MLSMSSWRRHLVRNYISSKTSGQTSFLIFPLTLQPIVGQNLLSDSWPLFHLSAEKSRQFNGDYYRHVVLLSRCWLYRSVLSIKNLLKFLTMLGWYRSQILVENSSLSGHWIRAASQITRLKHRVLNRMTTGPGLFWACWIKANLD